MGDLTGSWLLGLAKPSHLAGRWAGTGHTESPDWPWLLGEGREGLSFGQRGEWSKAVSCNSPYRGSTPDLQSPLPILEAPPFPPRSPAGPVKVGAELATSPRPSLQGRQLETSLGREEHEDGLHHRAIFRGRREPFGRGEGASEFGLSPCIGGKMDFIHKYSR